MTATKPMTLGELQQTDGREQRRRGNRGYGSGHAPARAERSHEAVTEQEGESQP